MRDIIKRSILLFLVFAFIMNISGCATLKKKFIRKPKPGRKPSPVLAPQDYRGIYPNSVLYNNHFTYWKGWTDELVDSLTYGLSNKRQIQAATLAIDDLTRMEDLLKSPKKEELSSHIKVYQRILGQLKLGRPNENAAARMRSDLESQKRLIIRRFDMKRVKDFILKEEEPIEPLSTMEHKLEE